MTIADVLAGRLKVYRDACKVALEHNRLGRPDRVREALDGALGRDPPPRLPGDDTGEYGCLDKRV